MASDLITEKLSFQVKSFQESFEILTNSISLNGMAKQFDKILRGNFFTTKVNIFHRDKNTPKWINLINKNVFQHQSEVENFDELALKIVANSDSSELFTITKLIDSKLIAIVLGKKFDGTSYSEIDKITFQIFILERD